ncbi:M15 family metallopeptidase [Asanoa sp. WMMD1127]|uniref:M15 family metallopeptidase n=1 Tax=Asanoa sp. WMMD1127 TaxID=3016107 RepID=UPI002416A877|nr:M15 family metallopeptidase [Asanoa sp. WMMD1127]MDG4825225.1 M15 family metallopeptidase [Asanoa sp. WMMD1127]
MPRRGARAAALVACVGLALGGCAGAPAGRAAPPVSTSAAPTVSPSPVVATPDSGATAAPSWLGTRVLPKRADGSVAAQPTPPELRDRSIVTVDDLPPPADGRFHSTVEAVPAAVLARSSWTTACPVASSDLRYLTVSFRGFDGLAHTGELLVNKRAADDLVSVFRQLFAADFPIERMRISSTTDLNAPPTGDGNTTEAFACRPVRGQKAWSQHAYGLAVDLNPFQNPYRKGQVVLPELASSYLDRAEKRPGMIEPREAAVRAFASIGWPWGGDYHALKDYMHFSASGG